MKNVFKYIITRVLIGRAKKHLKRHRTQVIAITGSVGKTSTKQAVYAVLKDKFKVYASSQGFNTQLGICLAILGIEESGFSSIKGWSKILKRAFSKDLQGYQKIILEMGADMPGDLKKLVKIAPPQIGIVTKVAAVHMEKGQFETIEAIAAEKNELIKNMSEGDLAILNADDDLVRSMETKAKKLFYGRRHHADLVVTDVKAGNKKLEFNVTYKNQSQSFELPVLGSFQIYTALPAIAAGLSLGMSLAETAQALQAFKLPPGRMNYIKGINGADIIDSSYNASPIAMQEALAVLNEVKGTRKIAALGTMNELGDLSEEAHLDAGKAAGAFADLLVAVGPEATTLKKGALEAEMDEKNIYTFFDSEEAGAFLAKELKAGDVVLAKGSQNKVRMEKLVKKIMENPEAAPKLLCRQEEAWSKM